MDDVTPIGARRLDGGLAPKPNTTPVTPLPAQPPSPRRREIASTVLELTGITTLVTGCYLVAPWLGLIIAGLCLILLGAATGMPR